MIKHRLICLMYLTLKYWVGETLKYWVGVQWVSLTSWGEGVSLALVGFPSSDCITINIPYGVDVLLHQQALHHIFSYWVS